MLAVALVLVPLACPPTTIGRAPDQDQFGHAFASPYGLYLDPRPRASRSEPVAPDLTLWDLELALSRLEITGPETRWIAWAIARAIDKPATAHGHLVAALADDSLSAARLSWWREQVGNDIETRDALRDAWDRSTAKSTRALLAAALALSLWEASCPVDLGPDKACRASSSFEARGQIIHRDPIFVEDARRWTARARALWRHTPSSDVAVASLEHELALTAATVDYESVLTAHLPEDLEFVIEDWRRGSGVPAWERTYARQVRAAEDSRRRVGRFFDSTTRCTRAMSELHAEAAAHADADVALLAVLREATLAVALEDAIYGGGPDRAIRRWDREERESRKRLSFRHSSESYYLEHARMLLAQCIEYGTAWGAAGELIDACFAWQSALDPHHLPTQAELIPELVARSSVAGHGLIAPAELDEHMQP